jgi:quinol monooxygenase YgiN
MEDSTMTVELNNFARFHAREGEEESVAATLRAQLAPVLAEPGCVAMEVFRGVRDRRMFYLHSRWIDEAAFQVHAVLPSTDRFIERMESLIDHPFDSTRTRALE